ncbi:hypothetical protein Emed_005399 [Eimeria media]
MGWLSPLAASVRLLHAPYRSCRVCSSAAARKMLFFWGPAASSPRAAPLCMQFSRRGVSSSSRPAAAAAQSDATAAPAAAAEGEAAAAADEGQEPSSSNGSFIPMATVLLVGSSAAGFFAGRLSGKEEPGSWDFDWDETWRPSAASNVEQQQQQQNEQQQQQPTPYTRHLLLVRHGQSITAPLPPTTTCNSSSRMQQQQHVAPAPCTTSSMQHQQHAPARSTNSMQQQHHAAAACSSSSSAFVFGCVAAQFDNVESTDDEVQGLTPLGRLQAEITGERLKAILKDKKIAGVYHSNMRRARETAEIVASKLGDTAPTVSAVQDPLLAEGVPAMPLPPSTVFHPSQATVDARYFYRPAPPNQLTSNNASGSSNSTTSSSTNSSSGSSNSSGSNSSSKSSNEEYTILICHGNVIRYFFCRALQLPPNAWLRLATFNCGITWLTIDRRGYVSARQFGDVGHLNPSLITYR